MVVNSSGGHQCPARLRDDQAIQVPDRTAGVKKCVLGDVPRQAAVAGHISRIVDRGRSGKGTAQRTEVIRQRVDWGVWSSPEGVSIAAGRPAPANHLACIVNPHSPAGRPAKGSKVVSGRIDPAVGSRPESVRITETATDHLPGAVDSSSRRKRITNVKNRRSRASQLANNVGS